MDKRTRILAVVFGAFVLYALGSGVVYPRFVRPLFTIDDRVKERKAVLATHEEREDRVKEAASEYRKFIARTGSLDPSEVEVEIRRRLNALIAMHGLKNSKVSGGRPRDDRKTQVTRKTIDVSANSSLESAVKFLRDLSELPHIVRLTGVTLTPVGANRRQGVSDEVALSVPIEVLVPPAHPQIGAIDKSKLVQPEVVVRHAGDLDYSRIWQRRPFAEFEPTRPIAVRVAQKNFSAHVGGRLQLSVSASGGNGTLRYEWSPAEGLSDVKVPNPSVDTSAAKTQLYTVTVSDDRGQRQSDTLTVTIEEKKQVAVGPVKTRDDPPPPPPPPAEDPPWTDGKYMQLNMAMMTDDGAHRVEELMVYNNKARRIDCYKPGDDFDGGKLVFVHPRGGVAVRNNKYYVYPLGETLDQSLVSSAATEYPELQLAAERHRRENEAPKPAKIEPHTKGPTAGAEEDPVYGPQPAPGTVAAEVPLQEPMYGPMPLPTVPDPAAAQTDEGAAKTKTVPENRRRRSGARSGTAERPKPSTNKPPQRPGQGGGNSQP